MATAFYVHGISIREQDYNLSFQQIESHLKQRESALGLLPCLWGDAYGAALKAGGASIPGYSVSKGLDGRGAQVDEEVGPWEALYADPLAELRLFGLRPAAVEPFDPTGRKTPSQLLDERIQGLTPSGPLAETLQRAGIDDQDFDAARRAVLGTSTYLEALNASRDDLTDFGGALARAIVAEMIARTQASRDWSALQVDADLRDTLVSQLTNELGGQFKGLVGTFLSRGLGVLATRYLSGSRGFFSGVLVPYLGDLLRYQGVGRPIRQLIRERIKQTSPPVVLLTHSLGGIACVELLAAEPLPEVELLVTVGSQAPFFYEMDALGSLRFGQPLPAHFPRWLNIYDRRDFLSFIGAPVFRDSLQRVEDVEVNNRQPFPWSHAAYWSNRQTWDAILPRLPREQR